MNLTEINQNANIGSKTYLKLKELAPNQPYPIINIAIVNSKFGEVVRVELEKCITFLPQRSTEPIKRNLSHFKMGKFGLMFKFMKEIQGLNPTPIFEIVEC